MCVYKDVCRYICVFPYIDVCQYFAKAAFAAKTMEIHHHFVRGVALAATSVVFIISGVASMRMIWDALTSRQNLEIPDDMPEIEPEVKEHVHIPHP